MTQDVTLDALVELPPLIGRPPRGSEVHLQYDHDIRESLCGAGVGAETWELDHLCPRCWASLTAELARLRSDVQADSEVRMAAGHLVAALHDDIAMTGTTSQRAYEALSKLIADQGAAAGERIRAALIEQEVPR